MRDVGGHDRPPAGRRAQPFGAQGPLGHQARLALEVPDSIRTWADWDEKAPGFVEIDVVGHEGGDPHGEFAQTLTVTDVFTGWTETKAVRNKAQKWVFAALVDLRSAFPSPVLGFVSDYADLRIMPTCGREPLLLTDFRLARSA